MEFEYTTDQLLRKIALQDLKIDRLEELAINLSKDVERLRNRPAVDIERTRTPE